MFEHFLKDIGLSEKEAKVYLALLEVDKNTIQDLAKKTGVNRTTVYPVLNSLQEKGLVSEVQDGKKIAYAAEPPERLETYVERQKVLFEEKSKRLKDVIPQIKSIQRESGERPVIKYFEGRDGSISAYAEFYEMHDKKDRVGCFIFNRDLLDRTYTADEQNKFRKIRVGKSVSPISVYSSDSGDLSFVTKGQRTRVDGKDYPILADITVIEDRIIISTLDKKVSSLLIKSADIATTISSLVRYINDNNKGIK